MWTEWFSSTRASLPPLCIYPRHWPPGQWTLLSFWPCGPFIMSPSPYNFMKKTAIHSFIDVYWYWHINSFTISLLCKPLVSGIHLYCFIHCHMHRFLLRRFSRSHSWLRCRANLSHALLHSVLLTSATMCLSLDADHHRWKPNSSLHRRNTGGVSS